MESYSAALFDSFRHHTREVPDRAHTSHTGLNVSESAIGSTSGLLEMSRDVQQYLNKRKDCQMARPSLRKPFHTWPQSKVWEQIHVDWAYIKVQGVILVVVDAGSSGIEALPTNV